MPYLQTVGEVKTKPTQHSVKELRSIGIQPDVLICRAARPLPENEIAKMALFTNVEKSAIISAVDVDNLYRIPRLFQSQGLDEIVVKKLDLKAAAADLREWDEVVEAMEMPTAEVTVAMVGKYTGLADSYKSLSEALIHAGIRTRAAVKIRYVDAEEVERKSAAAALAGADAILVPGGFGHRGIEGRTETARSARENGVPYLGICLGMQVAVIEFARHEAGLQGANSTEFNRDTPHPVIGLISEWLDRQSGGTETREADADLGGTMRLGGQMCRLAAGSLVRRLYGRESVTERHRHRYEFNNHYRQTLQDQGLRLAGVSADEKLVEIIEIPGHPWFVGCQFHPEFTSTPRDGHPLFSSFIEAALTAQQPATATKTELVNALA